MYELQNSRDFLKRVLFSKLNDVLLFKLIEPDYSVLLSNEAYYFIPICHFNIIEKHFPFVL